MQSDRAHSVEDDVKLDHHRIYLDYVVDWCKSTAPQTGKTTLN